MYTLVTTKSREPIPIGAVVHTFRGEEVTVIGFLPPRHRGGGGRVIVKFASGNTATFYPAVIHAKYTWIKPANKEESDG